jgi:Protein of unknown function (DUF1439)
MKNITHQIKSIFVYVCIVLAMSALLNACSFVNQIDLSEADIQKRLADKFPLKKCRLLLACVEVSQLNVKLPEGSSRINFESPFTASLGLNKASGRVAFSSTLRYDKESASFFLQDLAINNLEVGNVSPEILNSIKTTTADAFRTMIENYPIYTIKKGTIESYLSLSEVLVVNGKLRVIFK